MLKCFSFKTTGWGCQSLTTEHCHLRSAIINVTFALQTHQDQPYSHPRAAAFCLHPIGLSFLCNSPLACIPVPNHSTSSLIGLMGLGTKGFKAVWKCCSAIFVFLFKKNPKLLKQDHIAVIVFSNSNIILLWVFHTFLLCSEFLTYSCHSISALKSYIAFLTCFIEKDVSNNMTILPKAKWKRIRDWKLPR